MTILDDHVIITRWQLIRHDLICTALGFLAGIGAFALYEAYLIWLK